MIPTIRNVFEWGSRMILGVVLFYSGSEQMQNPWAFMISILKYDILPIRLSALFSCILPALEIVLSICLVSDIWRRVVLACAISLFAFYAIVQFIALYRGLDIDCGCFGQADSRISYYTIFRSVALMVFGIVALRFSEDEDPEHERLIH